MLKVVLLLVKLLPLLIKAVLFKVLLSLLPLRNPQRGFCYLICQLFARPLLGSVFSGCARSKNCQCGYLCFALVAAIIILARETLGLH